MSRANIGFVKVKFYLTRAIIRKSPHVAALWIVFVCFRNPRYTEILIRIESVDGGYAVPDRINL